MKITGGRPAVPPYQEPFREPAAGAPNFLLSPVEISETQPRTVVKRKVNA